MVKQRKEFTQKLSMIEAMLLWRLYAPGMLQSASARFDLLLQVSDTLSQSKSQIQDTFIPLTSHTTDFTVHTSYTTYLILHIPLTSHTSEPIYHWSWPYIPQTLYTTAHTYQWHHEPLTSHTTNLAYHTLDVVDSHWPNTTNIKFRWLHITNKWTRIPLTKHTINN